VNVRGFLIALMLVGLLSSLAAAQTMREAIEDVQPKMVKIYGAGGYKNLESYGTGFVVSPDGFVATVWSHLLDAAVITVVLDDGRRYEAELIGAEPRLELAVLKIDREELPFVDLDSITDAGIGSRVLAFSNMYQVAAGDEPMSVLHGVIAALGELSLRRGRATIAYDGPVYIVDAITNNSGAAGGLLTTRSGEPLAMIGRQLRNDESNIWLNYAIPLTELAPMIRQIQSGDFSRQETAGEMPDQADRFTALDFGIVMVPDVVTRTPAYIDAVQVDSLAAAVDLQPDDLVVFVNDRLVQSIRALESELGKLQPTDDVTLVVRRGESLVTVELTAPRRMP
jgi:serine protease Do